MTPERAIAALERRITVLFAGVIEPDSIHAYEFFALKDGTRIFVQHDAFANGERKHEAEIVREASDVHLSQLVDETVAAVQARYPDHANRLLLWRARPIYERYPGRTLIDEFHHMAPMITLYCRLSAVPVGATRLARDDE